MSRPIELTKIIITQEKPPHRLAYIGKFAQPIDYGVHGGVQDFYGFKPEKEYPSTLDHIVAAAGG
ncbi:hypothetical protein [Bacillus pinisoli]|uniref:hypothetical protein n=1 Tax=Bacillus pinisoli TaxID=2901866 RepID=UPI001FF25CFE|nr:hypothetical protein [Bacillus pinisoli]